MPKQEESDVSGSDLYSEDKHTCDDVLSDRDAHSQKKTRKIDELELDSVESQSNSNKSDLDPILMSN